MRETMLIVAALSALAAVICGLLGFVIYPAQAKRRQGHAKAVRRRGGRRSQKRRDDALPPRQGLARALFIVFAAAAFMCLFFGLLL